MLMIKTAGDNARTTHAPRQLAGRLTNHFWLLIAPEPHESSDEDLGAHEDGFAGCVKILHCAEVQLLRRR
jgi:hypothetical protein